MTPAEIQMAVQDIVAAVANEHGGACDVITPESTLHDDLGMDEADLLEVMLRAEARFGINLPDGDIGFTSMLSDVVDLVAGRLSEKFAVGVLPRLESPPISTDETNASVECPSLD